MKVEFYGKIKRDYILGVLDEVRRLVRIPENYIFYFLSNPNQCVNIPMLKGEHKKRFLQVCELERASFSFAYNNKQAIIIAISGEKEFLMRNKKALIGLVLHEIMHCLERKRDLEEKLNNSFDRTFMHNIKELRKLRYGKKITQNLFMFIGKIAVLLLKDLYASNEMIKRGFSEYLFEYYAEQFKIKKTCPAPVFYDRFTKDNLEDIKTALSFEFSLLSVILPFELLDTNRSSKIIDYIQRCYETNIAEITKRCHVLVNIYLNEFSESMEFQVKFLEWVFDRIYIMLK